MRKKYIAGMVAISLLVILFAGCGAKEKPPAYSEEIFSMLGKDAVAVAAQLGVAEKDLVPSQSRIEYELPVKAAFCDVEFQLMLSLSSMEDGNLLGARYVYFFEPEATDTLETAKKVYSGMLELYGDPVRGTNVGAAPIMSPEEFVEPVAEAIQNKTRGKVSEFWVVTRDVQNISYEHEMPWGGDAAAKSYTVTCTFQTTQSGLTAVEILYALDFYADYDYDIPTISEKIAEGKIEWSTAMEKGALQDVESFGTVESKRVYEYGEFSRYNMFSRNGTIDLGSSFNLHALTSLNDVFPVTNLTRISDDLIYTTYPLVSNDVTCTAYLFFARSDGKSDDQEYWGITGRVFFINKVLQYADFSDIQEGSKLQDVIEIDPSAQFQWYKNASPTLDKQITVTLSNGEKQKTTDNPYYYNFSTYHYLVDGILKITYGRDSVNEEPEVREVTFNKGHLVDCYGKGTLDFKIDPKDFP